MAALGAARPGVVGEEEGEEAVEGGLVRAAVDEGHVAGNAGGVGGGGAEDGGVVRLHAAAGPVARTQPVEVVVQPGGHGLGHVGAVGPVGGLEDLPHQGVLLAARRPAHRVLGLRVPRSRSLPSSTK